MAGTPEYDTPTKQAPRSDGSGFSLRVPNITLIQRIGKGGYGDVYVGEHHILKGKVAVKILCANQDDPNWTARFQREAKSLSKLAHPGIVKVYSFSFLENGQSAMVMEYVEGRSLEELVDSLGALSAQRSVSICKQLCDALAYAHELGIVHRDIKPSNIVISNEDQVKLLDFGIAKLLDDADGENSKTSKGSSQKLTATGQFMGTPAFMSPEQCKGMSAQPASDIYALGCVLYYMLFGRNLFSGNSDADVMLKHCKTTPKLKELNIPDDLMKVLVKALKKDPKERYANCSAMLSDLNLADLSKIRKGDRKGSAKVWAVIIAGAIPLLFLGKLCVNRFEAELEGRSSKLQVEKFKSLYAAGEKEIKANNAIKGSALLKEAIQSKLPEREKYRLLKAYGLLFEHLDVNHDDFSRLAREMLAIIQQDDLKSAPLNAEEKYRFKARAYLANARANRNNSRIFEGFIGLSSKLLSSNNLRKYNMLMEQLELFALEADYKRSSGSFDEAYELDKLAYQSIKYNDGGDQALVNYASEGLRSCAQFRAGPKFVEVHRNALMGLIAKLDDSRYSELPVFAGVLGAAYQNTEVDKITELARKLRATKAFRKHQDDYLVSYSVLNTFQHAISIYKGDLTNFTPEEIAYFEKDDLRLLQTARDPMELHSLVDMAAVLVRAKLTAEGEAAALKYRDQLLAVAPSSLWKLKLFAVTNQSLVQGKISYSEKSIEKINLHFLELLKAVASEVKSTTNSDAQLQTDILNSVLDDMRNVILESRLDPARKADIFLQWNQLLKRYPAIDSLVKFQSIRYSSNGINATLLKSQKYERVLEQLAEQYLSLLETYKVCKDDGSANILLIGFIGIADAFTAQSHNEKRWIFASKSSELFRNKDYFGMPRVRRFCVVYWIYAAALTKPENIDPGTLQYYRGELENETKSALSDSFITAHILAVEAMARIYDSKGEKATALEILQMQIKMAEGEKVPPNSMSMLTDELGKIAKP